MADHCYHYRGHLIPGCWNAALGIGDCTCRRQRIRKDHEAEVDAKLASMLGEIRALRRDVDQLRGPVVDATAKGDG